MTGAMKNARADDNQHQEHRPRRPAMISTAVMSE